MINPNAVEAFQATPRASLTQKQKLAVVKRQGGRCAACKGRFALADLEFDHVLPLALGGSNDLANIEALCRDDHRAKTLQDIKRIRKADRQRRAHEGAKPEKQKIRSRGFQHDPLTWRVSGRALGREAPAVDDATRSEGITSFSSLPQQRNDP